MEKGNKRRKIAVILATMNIEYANDALRGIKEAALEHQMDVYVFNANASTDETLKHNIGEYNIYKLLNYSMFDGVILFANLIKGYSAYNNVVEAIKSSGIAAVSIDAQIEDMYYVGVENYNSMKSIVDHLIEKHKLTKINFVAGMEFNSDNRERMEAYCDSLRGHGIPVEERRIFKGAFTSAHGRESAMKMLENPEDMPQAVVCATDTIAMGVRDVFDSYGIKIPQQVVLTGFDNTFEARNSVPALTTVSRNQYRVGQEAVRRIVEITSGENVPMKERFPSSPVYRESCGCCNEEENDLVTLQKKYVESAAHYEKYLNDNVMLVSDLSGSKSFPDMLKRLKKYVEEMALDSFYLCLDRELVDDLLYADTEKLNKQYHDKYQVEGFPQTMAVVMAKENGKFVSFEDFPSVQMLPDYAYNSEQGSNTYVFSAIHFQDRCMGYVALDNSEFALSSPLYFPWLINLSNSLESLRKQALLKKTVEHLDKMYVIDPLTELYNRFGFSRYAGESFSRCVSHDDSFMILFADMDGLKQINDKYGHDNGDVAILAVAAALRDACTGKEVCARMGGDEFVVYAEGYTADDAEAYCERLDKMLKEANEELDKPYQINVSYGCEVVFPERGETLDHYVDMADNKMYLNKKNKKGRLDDNVRIVT